jgi:predicted lipoprotein with Yx(FWY)xxD motif
MCTCKHRRIEAARWLRRRLHAAGALLLAVSGCIHLELYLTGYRSIPTIGWLFLLQVIVAFTLTALVLVTRSWLAAAASAVFALFTLGAYLVATWSGLFGFKGIRTRAGIAAGLIEVAAFGVLAIAALVAGPASGPASGSASASAAREPVSLPGRLQGIVSLAFGAVGAVSVAALAVLGVAEARAGGAPAVAGGVAVTLKTATVGGVTVLTNGTGRTLYWFAPDTPATSRCEGSCALYWPPVTGDPRAGPGVTGKLGTIKRPNGGLEATYNGHPLYTYVGDTAPGQAKGNNLDLNGGLWSEVQVSG